MLAERLARRFGREIGYSVLPYDARVHAAALEGRSGLGLVIDAVDNAAARRAIADTLGQHSPSTGRDASPAVLWLDAGNGRNNGQVLLGNALRPEQLHQAFDAAAGECHALPAPSLQRPDLLTAPPAPVARPRRDCARDVADGEQGRTINQMMAALVAAYVERLLDGTCDWMATYVDLDAGLLRCVPAEPRQVAPLAGLHPNALVKRASRAS